MASLRIEGDYPLDWRLGFVRWGDIFFFKDDPKDVYGDDWNDAPVWCNAGAPGSEFECFTVKTDGPLTYSEDEPYFSAQEHNSLTPPAPWLRTNYDTWDNKPNVGIYGRTTFGEFLRICREVGQRVFVPVEWGEEEADND